MRFRRHLAAAVTAAALAVTLAPAAPGVASALTAGRPAIVASHPRPSPRFLARARTALVSYLGHARAGLVPAHVGTPRTGSAGTPGTAGSYNWSGYEETATTDGTFTKVSGAWVTPKVSCTAEDTLTSEWVGLDGGASGSTTVEQDGTLDWCYKGTPTYFTWYEMYPAGTMEVGKALAPGDKIAAKVSRSGTKYTLALTDSTSPANSFSVTATCAATVCLDTSAEWVAERPSFSIGIAPLAHFSTWTLTRASATANGVSGPISAYPASDSLSMVDATSAYQLATPSPLNAAGNRFSVTWLNSY